jgi:hypothetical protein
MRWKRIVVTISDSTTGTKNIVRRNARPGIARLSSSASPKPKPTSNGVRATTNRIELTAAFQKMSSRASAR